MAATSQGWRDQLAERGPALVEAWARPAAWEGMTRAGGVDLPGQVAGLVALDEVTLHGWDLARATGQDYTCDDDTAAALYEFVSGFDEEGTPGMFGPAVQVEGETLSSTGCWRGRAGRRGGSPRPRAEEIRWRSATSSVASWRSAAPTRMTGFYRDGCCNTGPQDRGQPHDLCRGDRGVPRAPARHRQRPLDAHARVRLPRPGAGRPVVRHGGELGACPP